jgi:hypothetical protein
MTYLLPHQQREPHQQFLGAEDRFAPAIFAGVLSSVRFATVLLVTAQDAYPGVIIAPYRRNDLVIIEDRLFWRL